MGTYETYKIMRKVRDAFIKALRAGFSQDEVYTWDSNKNDSRILISDATPLENTELPSIIITSSSGKEQRYLGPDYLKQAEDKNDIRFVSLPASVSIKTYTLSPIDRDELGDMIFEYLKVVTDKLAELGIEIQNIQINGDTREFRQDRWWYSGNYTIQIYTEWVYKEDKDIITVESFTVEFNEQEL